MSVPNVNDLEYSVADASFAMVDAPGSFANAGTCPTWPEGFESEDEVTVDVVETLVPEVRGSVKG